jgi:hypothetical protein
VALCETLDAKGITAYLENSRGGRGAHVWLLFDPPGVLSADLHVFLDNLAEGVRSKGPVDVFPSAPKGRGRAIFLPYFSGVVNLIDVDLKTVPPDKLEGNNPSVIPPCPDESPTWPPKHWNLHRPAVSGRQAEFQTTVEEGRRQGLVFDRGSQPQARRGYRNNIAGGVAKSIFCAGGSFEDFEDWDSFNEPPLASDEPKRLRNWWRWAERQNKTHRVVARAT